MIGPILALNSALLLWFAVLYQAQKDDQDLWAFCKLAIAMVLIPGLLLGISHNH